MPRQLRHHVVHQGKIYHKDEQQVSHIFLLMFLLNFYVLLIINVLGAGGQLFVIDALKVFLILVFTC